MSRPLLLGIAIVLGAGCANTSVTHVWSDPGLQQAKFDRALVLVLSPSYGRRQTAEDRIVAELTKLRVKAVKSWDALPQEALRERERIRDVANERADAVFAVRVKHVARDVREYQEQQWAPVATGLDYYGYVSTIYALYDRPDTAEVTTVVVESTLWDVTTGRLVWSCESNSKSANQTLTTAELTDDYADVVGKRVAEYFRRK